MSSHGFPFLLLPPAFCNFRLIPNSFGKLHRAVRRAALPLAATLTPRSPISVGTDTFLALASPLCARVWHMMVGMAKQKLTPKQNRQQAEILKQTAIKLIE